MSRILQRQTRAMLQRLHRYPTQNMLTPWQSRWQALSSETETVSLKFVEMADGVSIPVKATVGDTILDCAHKHDIDLEGACGGELACSTCHVVLSEEWFAKVGELSELSEEEEDMLDLAWGLTDTSRLGCQIVMQKELDGLTVIIPDESDDMR
mmetsp:Transcript_2900/g.3323  ORF Transcript_2900/g.3323 Transcript_2900/m.3323 type:complete len:153 (-) Transcript_2900:31-489(-)